MENKKNKNDQKNFKKIPSKKVTNSTKAKVVKMNNGFHSPNFIYTKKIKTIFIIILIILFLLIARIGILQFIDGNYLKEKAYQQQAINQIISPKRGNIYDSTGKALAISAQVDTITINPTKIKDDKNDEQKTKEIKEKVAKGLSDIFTLDYNETLEKVNSKSQVETIIKKVEQEKVDQLKAWMKENKMTAGINIDEDTKRYYPYSTVASHVIGFCGSDNQGLYGIENSWESVLTGTPGKIVSSKDGSQKEIPNAEENYIAPENGSDLTLTIDLNIQTIVEKYLKQAVDDNNCSSYGGGTCIAMNPKTGDILAMANYPDYDLNTPFTPNSYVAKTYDSLATQEKSTALYTMWKNGAVSSLYEPGSVFKIITSAVALEENITGTDIKNDFYCSGSENVSGTPIDCWKYKDPHLSQTLRKALENSCNPAFMQLGKRITAPVLYQYYQAFGLFDKTNVALPSEENSLFTNPDKVGPVELATMSFGQRLNITPLQMITAASSICNDGILMQPRIVKEVKNTDTGSITTINPVKVRQVISKQTAQDVKSMMESVVVDGTGYRGSVTGYSIGGKTGTSEPLEANKDDGYVASFIAISPVEDTQIVLLLTLHVSKDGNYQGGQVVAPVVSQMLTEILPYLGIPSDANSTSSTDNLITVPDVRNKTITEAEKALKGIGLSSKISTTNDKNSTLVIDQVPKPGTALLKNATIMLYDQTVKTSVTVPDLKGKTAAQVTSTLKSLNLNISIEGSGTVVSQEPAINTQVDEGSIIKVTLKQPSKDSH